IIPEPVEIKVEKGFFEITKKTSLHADKRLKDVSEYLHKLFRPALGWSIPSTAKTNDENSIKLSLDDGAPEIGEEGYILKSTEKGILIKAKTPAGVFYGIQTLRQLLPKEIESQKEISNMKWLVPCITVKDYPRFKWRGFMLDEARHFMGIKVAKKMLDLMALHKLNKFHWHLVDDQGWRIKIDKYPKLTDIGSKRELKPKRGEVQNTGEGNVYGGFYTKEEIKDIIAYATERFIEVIPEIEMPGHSMSALAAYPELSCSGGPFEVPTRWGIFADVYCPGNDRVYEFLKDVIDEVIELFPSEIIHIGGDEVPKIRWRSCKKCREKMKEEGITKFKDLQVLLTNYFAKYLESKGRRLMGWNQILEENLAKNAISQYWFGKVKETIAHLEEGRDTVMTRYLWTYLDHPYKIISLQRAYKYEPIPKKLEEKYHNHVLGLEAPLWTERIPNEQRLYWQAFPRLTAFAETGWTPKKSKNYKKFKEKMEFFLKRLDILGINYATLEEAD
ncbi:MAG: beta-N-acetylhexosaminidase, partial [Candidatus Heimdallarchaeota archaeon]|nr:beta-N-acetylhexosaminidase [Candidatus Heimdallarchaeota archaeon]